MATTSVCGAPTDVDARCQRTVLDGGRCFMHSEDGPPADHGAPEGNDNARGHRAPHVALNGFKHGADAKLSTLLLSMGMLRVRHRPTDERLLVAPDGTPDSPTAWQVVVNLSRPERTALDHVETGHIELLDYAPGRTPRPDE